MFNNYINIDDVLVIAIIDCDDYETIQKRLVEEELKFQDMLEKYWEDPENNYSTELCTQEVRVNSYRKAMYIVAQQLGY
jgi:hypothetical protein